jgi:hypothetical protein
MISGLTLCMKTSMVSDCMKGRMEKGNRGGEYSC